MRRIWDLHRRHGQEVISVVDGGLKNNAGVTQALELPTSSLLAMIVSPVAKQPDYVDPVEAEPTAAAQAAADPRDFTVEPLAFAVDPSTRKRQAGGGIS